ncbi:class I SAM-dependent methyltransferase [Streptomyces odontomachi]|uniref:class I SAM-dependent methyltransferase n=1 Tax=Streptomyces odontomachi TaxID=2944940 RepID=UPI00210BCCA9|nr:class I SAM-dependent methyltransferase [Streptomyces sp. ODS25]
MFAPEGPTVRELAVQALSSVERGYDLLAPKFDVTPFRTPDAVLDAVTEAIRPLGPFQDGLDLCCGTGAGMDVLAQVCRGRITGVDFSMGMLTQARASRQSTGRPAAPATGAGPLAPAPAHTEWVRGDARALPFGAVFDLVVSFGAFGHFLPRERPRLFDQVRQVLRPGGRFVFPIAELPAPSSPAAWMLLAFDVVMRVRNAVWRPPFVMYYRTFRPDRVRGELTAAGFDVTLHALPALGSRADGSPRCGMIVATRRGGR